jgi:hypothetical protein
MSQADLNRVRDDLATIKQAVGMELPFGRTDVRLNLMIFGAGVFASVWTALAPWGKLVLVGLIPVALVGIAYVTMDVRRSRRRTTGSPVYRRELKSGLIMAAVLFLLVKGYWMWGESMGVSARLAGATAVFLAGVGLIPWGLSSRGQRPELGAAIALILYGVAIPFVSARGVVVGAGITLAICGLAMAAIQSYQLRTAGGAHAAD